MPRIYKTKQYDEILSCMQKHESEHLTAADVTALLRREGSSVGSATVYRQLERMVLSGEVRRYVTGQNSPACYQYAGGEGCTSHYHLRCTACGSLIHLDCDLLSEIAAHIASHHQFEIDPGKTVFYGLCAQCRGVKTQKKECACHDC